MVSRRRIHDAACMQRTRSSSASVTSPSRTRASWCHAAAAAASTRSGRPVACTTKTPVSTGTYWYAAMLEASCRSRTARYRREDRPVESTLDTTSSTGESGCASGGVRHPMASSACAMSPVHSLSRKSRRGGSAGPRSRATATLGSPP